MSLDKRQKKLVIAFVVGMAALFIDRAFLRPQGGAKSASADYGSSDERVSSTDNLPILASESPRPQIAVRLESVWSGDNSDFARLRNPFSTPASWLGVKVSSPKRTDKSLDAFAKRHQLTAVAGSGPTSYVLMGDEFLVVGQEIDGYRLVSIGQRSVVFERQGREVTLELGEDQ